MAEIFLSSYNFRFLGFSSGCACKAAGRCRISLCQSPLQLHFQVCHRSWVVNVEVYIALLEVRELFRMDTFMAVIRWWNCCHFGKVNTQCTFPTGQFLASWFWHCQVRVKSSFLSMCPWFHHVWESQEAQRAAVTKACTSVGQQLSSDVLSIPKWVVWSREHLNVSPSSS